MTAISTGKTNGSTVGSWFVVLPDREPASGVAHRLRGLAPRVVSHPSGRPWILGDWTDDQALSVDLGPLRVALFGWFDRQAARRCERVRALADLGALAGELAGSFHVIGSAHGEVRVQGSVSGARRVFHTMVGEVCVAADRARILANLSGAEPDTGQIAVRLAYGELPSSVVDSSMWHRVNGVPGGWALCLDTGGTRRVERWWYPPEPRVPLVDGAAAVRDALADAVALRARPDETVAADLSGGLDSTSICFLAARAGARLIATSVRWADPSNEDVVWARRAASASPLADRLLDRTVFEPGELPAFFTDLSTVGQPADEPVAIMRNGAQKREIAAMLRDRGARLWLSGHGGDDVLQAPAHHLRGTLARHPLLGFRQVAGLRSRRRWSLASTAGALVDPRGYRRWLTGLAGRLRDAGGIGGPPWGWGDGLWMPPWASDAAVEEAAAVLRAAARGAAPLAPTRGQHARLHAAQTAGRQARQLEMASHATGLPVVAPFCDDRVVRACLAVRSHETSQPWQYKPLLVAAMRGVVPDSSLARTTKDRATVEWYQGLDQQRAELARLAEESELVRRGLADPQRLRTALLSPRMLTVPAPALEQTLAVEVWLRHLDAHPGGDALSAAGRPTRTVFAKETDDGLPAPA